MSKPKAVALYSGGLDSTLAILVMQKQGIDVTAVTFMNHFGCDISDRSSCSKDHFAASEKFGFQVKLAHLSDKFLEIVKNPKHGHGRNMNPCVDCRILMLKEAKDASQAFAREGNVEVSWERLWSIAPRPFNDELIDFCDEAIREACGQSHRLPSGPLHDAAEVAIAGVPTVMMFVQSLHGISHNKIEDTREEHIELSVKALDGLAEKTMNWIRQQG